MSTSNTMFQLGMADVANAIKYGADKRTVLVQGEMGTGKTAILKLLANDPELVSHVSLSR